MSRCCGSRRYNSRSPSKEERPWPSVRHIDGLSDVTTPALPQRKSDYPGSVEDAMREDFVTTPALPQRKSD